MRDDLAFLVLVGVVRRLARDRVHRVGARAVDGNVVRRDALRRRVDQRAAVPVRGRVLAQFVLWNFVDFVVFVLGPAVLFLKVKFELF